MKGDITKGLVGGTAAGITTFWAGVESNNISYLIALSLAMCLLGGAANMLFSDERLTLRKILAKILTSMLLAMLTFFFCIYRHYHWSICGFVSGFCGWLGYPVLLWGEKVWKKIFKKEICGI